jgi:hypothetical protein
MFVVMQHLLMGHPQGAVRDIGSQYWRAGAVIGIGIFSQSGGLNTEGSRG